MKTRVKTAVLILCCIACIESDIIAQHGTLEATEGVIVGNNTGVVAGTIRWTGTDFEGYDGSNWVSLTPITANVANGLKIDAADNTLVLGGMIERVTTLTLGGLDFVYNLNGAGKLRIQDGGADKFTVLDNGRVAVGGPDHAGAFNVTGRSYYSDDLFLRDGSVTGQNLIRLYDSSNNGVIDVYGSGGVTGRIHASGNSFLNGGNLGIGTANPLQKLHVSGTGRFTSLGGLDTRMVVASPNGDLMTQAIPSGTTFIADIDSDTNIDTEKIADEDIIRYTVAGIEFASMDGQTFHLESAGQSLFIGLEAGTNDDGINNLNTAVGHKSMSKNSTGDNNTALGHSTLTTNTTGSRNTAVGKDALKENNNGISNTATGYQSLTENISGKENTAFGDSALANNTTANSNTAVGFQALSSNTIGERNTAVGKSALLLNATASDNIAIGDDALANNTAGYENTSLGNSALKSNTMGFQNTGIGFQALRDNTLGDENTAIGYSALKKNTTGKNTAIGHRALESNISGTQNTAVGQNALNSTTIGSRNTAVGYSTLNAVLNYSGADNTAIGWNVSILNAPSFGSTGIGSNAVITANNQVRIGSVNVLSIGGQVSWTTFSDGRFMSNVKEDIHGLEFINRLRPVSYLLDLNAQRKSLGIASTAEKAKYEKKVSSKQTGFIAQEVHATAQALGFEFSGVDAPKNEKDYYGIRYAEFVVPLVKAVQELSALNESVQKENQALIESNAALKTRMDRIEIMLTNLDNKD